MTDRPLITILMSVFNAEPYIAQAIDSVFAQTYANWELVIVDDVSRDKTREVIDRYSDPRIRKVYNTVNEGYVASKNRLLALAQGSLVCMLDADDWMTADRLEKQYQVFLDHPQTMACMCAYTRVDPEGNEHYMPFYAGSGFIDLKKESINFAGAGVMFRREVISAVGGFHLYFDRLLGDDNYWAHRIAERFPFYYLETPLYYYRANPASLTATLDNPRKLTIIEALDELKRQRASRGSDWLEEGHPEKLLAYEQGLARNSRWMAEKYRNFAALRLDFGDLDNAWIYLRKAFQLHPLNVSALRTLVYYLKVRRKGRQPAPLSEARYS